MKGSEMKKQCANCAWFCHMDRKCYGIEGMNNGYPTIPDGCECSLWAYDGLEDWEREPETLMTMEQRK